MKQVLQKSYVKRLKNESIAKKAKGEGFTQPSGLKSIKALRKTLRRRLFGA